MNIMKDKILSKSWIKKFLRSFLSEYKFQKVNEYTPKWSRENINITKYIRKGIISLIILCSLWV